VTPYRIGTNNRALAEAAHFIRRVAPFLQIPADKPIAAGVLNTLELTAVSEISCNTICFARDTPVSEAGVAGDT
jgi:hypothetical protein